MSTFGSPGGRQVISKPTPYVPIHCSYTTKYTAKWHPQYAVNDTNESANAEKQRPQRGSFPLDHDGRLFFHFYTLPFIDLATAPALSLPVSSLRKASFNHSFKASTDYRTFSGECKHIMSSYLSCLRQHRGVNENECRMLSKSYLQCRMDRYTNHRTSYTY